MKSARLLDGCKTDVNVKIMIAAGSSGRRMRARRRRGRRSTLNGVLEHGIWLSAPVDKSEQEWREQLTPEQYEVLRKAGTEAPFTGELRLQQGLRLLPLRGLRHGAVRLGHQVRLRHGLAELHRAGRRRGRRAAAGQQPVHAPHRGRAAAPAAVTSGTCSTTGPDRPGSATASTRPRSRFSPRPSRKSRQAPLRLRGTPA